MSSKSDIADWNRIAETYAQGLESGPRFPYIVDALQQLIGDVAGLEILDLGCGQGWLAGKLDSLGARVTGTDGSLVLLERAREQFTNVRFVQANLAEGLPNLDNHFDVIVSHTVLMDIPSLRSLFKDVAATLKSDGRFIFTLLHPCFWNQKSHLDHQTGEWHKEVKGYLEHEVWRVEDFGGHNHYHRPVTYYATELHQAGMVIRQLIEPQHESTGHTEIPEDFTGRHRPRKRIGQQFPLFLVIEAVKHS